MTTPLEQVVEDPDIDDAIKKQVTENQDNLNKQADKFLRNDSVPEKERAQAFIYQVVELGLDLTPTMTKMVKRYNVSGTMEDVEEWMAEAEKSPTSIERVYDVNGIWAYISAGDSMRQTMIPPPLLVEFKDKPLKRGDQVVVTKLGFILRRLPLMRHSGQIADVIGIPKSGDNFNGERCLIHSCGADVMLSVADDVNVQKGDRIVTAGVHFLRENTKVTPLTTKVRN